MNLKVGLMSVAMSMGLAASAHAKDSGLELGARLGFGLPLGNAEGAEAGEPDEEVGESAKLSDVVSRKIPLQLDVGYRVNPQLMIGGYFQYALASLAFNDQDDEDACDGDRFSCSASVTRLGAQAIYHFTPITAGSAGWIGGGIGYEWLKLNIDGGGLALEGTIKGFEFLNAQGGYDFMVNEKFRVGPYLLVSMARYDSASLSVSSADGEDEEDESGDIENKSFHAWISFGVKATFGAF